MKKLADNEKKSSLSYYADRYFIKAMGAMAKGIFATLLIGTILAQFARIPWTPLQNLLNVIVAVCQNGNVIGGAIGAAMAFALGAKPFTLCSAIVAGAIGYTSGAGGAGPVGSYIAALVGIEIGRLVEGRTKVDILLVPLATILTGGVIGYLLGMPLGAFMEWLGKQIARATYMHPIPMGIILSMSMGLILTAPISSAAVAAMILVVTPQMAGSNLETGIMLAAGAATIGCCCHMVGFAAASFKENGWGGVVSLGLGTSMLQVPNVIRHPQILIPPTLSSIILGPLGTTLFQMKNIGVSGGMGTCGLVGQIGTFTTMLGTSGWLEILLKVLLLHIAAPALLTLLFSEFMHRMGWIKRGSMTLE